MITGPSHIRTSTLVLWEVSLAEAPADPWGKLRLRIEDPPRRKHMVFYGGTVLADIMKKNGNPESSPGNEEDIHAVIFLDCQPLGGLRGL
ncbi:hypothetical protein Taro_020831 [Colocasia esculenta]|uniref:Uncharacterized protein n=1 Tax=Colocasia esculenta TaxID=4460 RepID=A0A843V9P0_COLES|nr:hypothetical protein [Colocasia esculenta]